MDISEVLSFRGRVNRADYWSVTLLAVLWSTAATPELIGLVARPPAAVLLVLGITALVIGLINLATTVKRLHDVGRTGWFALITFIPYGIGYFALLIWLGFTKGSPEPNRFGPSPANVSHRITAAG
jgi:uncharacterized membrane protein YhaH (DUF805 family)